MRKMIIAKLSAILLSLLIAVLVLEVLKPEHRPIPEPGSPYTPSDLKAITRVHAKGLENLELPENAISLVLENIAPLIKTFTGEKYAKFEPILTFSAGSSAFPREGFIRVFQFEGDGYVDLNSTQADHYSISILFWDWGSQIEQVYFYPNWGGVPEQYRSMAMKIALGNSEVQEVRGEAPSVGYLWNPEKYAHVSISFDPIVEISIPESPYASVQVDLENQKVVSILKSWLEEFH